MRKFLLGSVVALVMAPADADNITMVATADGVVVDTVSSGGLPTLNLVNVAFGPAFNLNTLSLDSQAGLAAPDVINTNTLNVAATSGASGAHSLVLDITATGLTGTGALEAFLSTFSITGITTGWTANEETFVDGGLLHATGPIGTTSSSTAIDSALQPNPFSAEVRYTIDSFGTGNFNGGIDISTQVAPVPGPVAGSGVPGLAMAVGAIVLLWRRRTRDKPKV